MSNETEGGAGAPKSPGASQKPVEAEPVDAPRGATSKTDPAAEDAAVLSQTGPDQTPPEHPETDPDPEPVRPAESFFEEPEERAQTASGGGGASRAIWAAAGALIGGAVVLFAGEALRPETLPVAEIATKQALESRIDAEIKRLALEVNDRIADAQTKTEKNAERLALLDDRGARADEAATTAKAAQEAEMAKLREELAIERTRIGRLNNELAARERERVAAVTAIREQVSALAAAVAATPGGAIGEQPTEGVAETGSAPSAAATTRMALLEGGLRRLETRINGLSSEALPTPDLSRIDQLEATARAERKAREALGARLDGVERASRTAVTGGAALGVAFAALSDAVASAKPYQEPLDLVRDLAPPSAEISDALSAFAAGGLPSYASLSEWLETASWDALDAAAKARLRSGEASVLDRLSNVFTFRPHLEPGATPDSDAALLDRARRRIEARDAIGAVAETDNLSAAAKTALAAWREEAGRRAAAEQSLSTLRTQLLGGAVKKQAENKSEAGR